ncbi:hypothetical protein TCDM_06337 [Trypanosoma cruzi Dm28c]|uniref:Transmembrane protein n=1 Tax=Trypanosoma cruzi Dm28c TaxID=1416333 RepID=V5BGU6_TRYCR|nr:hypothetical protein TCDM_06337 [Trypanosoma cruzi Dm28c]
MHATIGTDIACGNGALVGEEGGEGGGRKKGMGESSFNFLYYFYPFLCVVCVFVFSSFLSLSFFFFEVRVDVYSSETFEPPRTTTEKRFTFI